MVQCMRSGWTPALGHVPQPVLDATALASQIFYDREISSLSDGQPLIEYFVRHRQIERWATAGSVHKRRSEKALFVVTRYVTLSAKF